MESGPLAEDSIFPFLDLPLDLIITLLDPDTPQSAPLPHSDPLPPLFSYLVAASPTTARLAAACTIEWGIASRQAWLQLVWSLGHFSLWLGRNKSLSDTERRDAAQEEEAGGAGLIEVEVLTLQDTAFDERDIEGICRVLDALDKPLLRLEEGWSKRPHPETSSLLSLLGPRLLALSLPPPSPPPADPSNTDLLYALYSAAQLGSLPLLKRVTIHPSAGNPLEPAALLPAASSLPALLAFDLHPSPPLPYGDLLCNIEYVLTVQAYPRIQAAPAEQRAAAAVKAGLVRALLAKLRSDSRSRCGPGSVPGSSGSAPREAPRPLDAMTRMYTADPTTHSFRLLGAILREGLGGAAAAAAAAAAPAAPFEASQEAPPNPIAAVPDFVIDAAIFSLSVLCSDGSPLPAPTATCLVQYATPAVLSALRHAARRGAAPGGGVLDTSDAATDREVLGAPRGVVRAAARACGKWIVEGGGAAILASMVGPGADAAAAAREEVSAALAVENKSVETVEVESQGGRVAYGL